MVLQLPTGAGKTATAAAIIRSALGKGKRVIFTVPAISLITQTIDSFRRDGITDIGVMQGQHILTDADQPVQICSVQTLARRTIPEADLIFIDECHTVFDLYKRWLNDPAWAAVPFIGLSATPWTRGLGKLYKKLIVGSTIQSLIDQGHLSKFRVFAPSKPDLTDVKTVAGDYALDDLSRVMNRKEITADIVKTWIEKGENRPTLCFAVDRAHAAAICDEFNRAGIPAAYVDGENSLVERDELAQEFKAGKYKVICNVGVMTTGVDLPFVSAIILARPTRSEMLYVQIIGRGLRTYEGKTDCLALDHSDTTARLGFVTDIGYTTLNDGTHKVGHGAAKKEKEEPKPKTCPSCTHLVPARHRVCSACGFEFKRLSNVMMKDGKLVEFTGKGRDKFAFMDDETMPAKEQFYRELLGIATSRNYKHGWAYHQYRAKYNENPHKDFIQAPLPPSDLTERWVKHLWIKRKKAQQKAVGMFR